MATSQHSSLSILKLDAADWRELCKYLNLHGSWFDLGTQMGIDVPTLIHLKTTKGLNNGAEDLLLHWASLNGTITELFIHLSKMNFQVGLHILKKYVDPKYHKYIRMPHETFSSEFDIAKGFSEFSTTKLPMIGNNHLGDKRHMSKTSYNVPPTHSLNVLSQNLHTSQRKLSPPAKQIIVSTEEKVYNIKVPVSPEKNQLKSKKDDDNLSLEVKENIGDILCVPFEEIAAATNNFDDKNILGQGGFGVVYRGKWKGNLVAIKCLKPKVGKNPPSQVSHKQLINEMKILKKARIDNILNLYGVCLKEDSPCLIYQYMANGSLEDRLLCKNNTPPLTWAQRSKIMEGTAKGLNYLHTLPKPEVHGDIKSANILLDHNMEAKIGDFGLSKEGPTGHYTHCKVSKLHGTQVYLPPEYLRDHHLSTKVDVYSYGIVLLEVATGQRAFHDKRQPHLLVDYVAVHYNNQNLTVLRDTKAGMEGMPWFLGMLHLGIDCTRPRKKERPDMAKIMDIFEDLKQQQTVIDRVRRKSKDGTPLNECPEHQQLTPHDIQYIHDINKLNEASSSMRGPPPTGVTLHPSNVRDPPSSQHPPSFPAHSDLQDQPHCEREVESPLLQIKVPTNLGKPQAEVASPQIAPNEESGAEAQNADLYSVPLLTILGVGVEGNSSPKGNELSRENNLSVNSDFSINFSFSQMKVSHHPVNKISDEPSPP